MIYTQENQEPMPYRQDDQQPPKDTRKPVEGPDGKYPKEDKCKSP